MKLAEESSNSLDIIRLDESAEVAQPQCDEEEEEKENKKSFKPVPRKWTKLQKQTQEGSTPVFKVPRPLAHHSTPAPSGDLFGFEELDSPLTLSPVTTTPAGRGSSPAEVGGRQSPEEEGGKVVKPSPYSRLKGTYDIPFKKKTPRRPAARRRKVGASSGEVPRDIGSVCVCSCCRALVGRSAGQHSSTPSLEKLKSLNWQWSERAIPPTPSPMSHCSRSISQCVYSELNSFTVISLFSHTKCIDHKPPSYSMYL